MSKAVYICMRNARDSSLIRNTLVGINKRITPDNIHAAPLKIVESDGIIIGIFNPTEITIQNGSICLGSMIDPEEWHLPMHRSPDGTYALFQSNRKCIQVLTDVVATRTIWYFLGERIFVASTSQRAIVSVLGSFEFNNEVIPWILSTGSLGPFHGWDRRIKRLCGDSSITLDRESWTLTEKTNDVQFSPEDLPDREHEKRLRQALEDSFKKIRLNYSQWILPLSGGFDSRGILCMLADTTGLRAIIWGLKSSLNEKMNDAYIARQLAEAFTLPHDYYETDKGNELIENILYRFLLCGEGRIDHLSGYMDGFKIWKTVFEKEIKGIIRGDEGFGWKAVSSPLDVRRSVGVILWSDFSNLRELDHYGFPQQKMPETFVQQEHESLATWRDRLYHNFRIPIVLAALNDLKLPYVELIYPLLSRKIIYEIRRLPDHLRTDKRLFKSIVGSLSPRIDYAKYSAIASRESILRSNEAIAFLKQELTLDYVDSILPREFIDDVLNQMVIGAGRQKTANAKSRLRKRSQSKKMDFNILAFRTYMICRMNKMLSSDAELGRQKI